MPTIVELDTRTTAVLLRVNKAETFTLTFPVLDDTDHVVSVAGWTAVAQVRQEGGPEALYFEWSTSAGSATCGPDGVVLQFLGEVTALWPWSSGVFELTVKDALGIPGIIARGPLLALDPVVR